jgi:biotin synthase
MFFTDNISEFTDFKIDTNTAFHLTKLNGSDLLNLFAFTNSLRLKNRGNRVDLCSIVNAKSGSCPEDCTFCAQSVHNKTDINKYPMIAKEEILRAAATSKEKGVKHFCIVTSGKKASSKELDNICEFVYEVKKLGLSPCATLGMLNKTELQTLRDAGLERYHHNLETSETFFREICTTHSYKEKVSTIKYAQSVGLSICSGGIFGLGESWDDRIEMAFALKNLNVDSVPINFLTPVKGTPLGSRELLNPIEALKIIAIYRLVLSDCEIRICGGRPNTLRDLNAFIFAAGADGLLIGNYLTTLGRHPEDDLQMIKDCGLKI